jgi:hypothetical protein
MNNFEYLLVVKFAIYAPIFFLVFLSFFKYSLKYQTEKQLLIVYVLSLSLIFALRPLTLGMDTINYFNLHFSRGLISDFKLSFELIFDFLIRVVQMIGVFEVFLFLVSFLSMYFIYYTSRRISESEQSHSTTLTLFFMMSGISFMSMQMNTLKAGLAISVMLVGVYYLSKNKTKLFFLISIIAFLIHNIIIVMIFSAIVVYYIKLSLRVYLFGYLMVNILVYFQIISIYTISFLGDFLLEYQGNYQGGYQTGYRFDFSLYNTVWLLIASALQKKSNTTVFWIKLYIILSCIFFLFFAAPYSDRIGMLSWAVAPIMLVISLNKFYNPLKWLFLAIFSIINFSIIALL